MSGQKFHYPVQGFDADAEDIRNCLAVAFAQDKWRCREERNVLTLLGNKGQRVRKVHIESNGPKPEVRLIPRP